MIINNNNNNKQVACVAPQDNPIAGAEVQLWQWSWQNNSLNIKYAQYTPAAMETQACSFFPVSGLTTLGGSGAATLGDKIGSGAVLTTLQNCSVPIARDLTKDEPFLTKLKFQTRTEAQKRCQSHRLEVDFARIFTHLDIFAHATSSIII